MVGILPFIEKVEKKKKKNGGRGSPNTLLFFPYLNRSATINSLVPCP